MKVTINNVQLQLILQMSPMDHIPTGAKGRGGGRRNGHIQGMHSMLNDGTGVDPNGFGGSAGLTTIDRRPGRPTFHHMGPLPDIPPVIRRADTKINVSNDIYKNNSIIKLAIKYFC